jgi:hypothetical protein
LVVDGSEKESNENGRRAIKRRIEISHCLRPIISNLIDVRALGASLKVKITTNLILNDETIELKYQLNLVIASLGWNEYGLIFK